MLVQPLAAVEPDTHIQLDLVSFHWEDLLLAYTLPYSVVLVVVAGLPTFVVVADWRTLEEVLALAVARIACVRHIALAVDIAADFHMTALAENEVADRRREEHDHSHYWEDPPEGPLQVLVACFGPEFRGPTLNLQLSVWLRRFGETKFLPHNCIDLYWIKLKQRCFRFPSSKNPKLGARDKQVLIKFCLLFLPSFLPSSQ